MQFKDLLKEKIALSGLSKSEVARLLGVTPPLITGYLNGVMPSEQKLQSLSEILNFNLDEIDKPADLTISVDEAAAMMGKSVLFVRNAIKKGRMPGSYVESKNNTSFHIPRLAFYRYMGIEPPLR